LISLGGRPAIGGEWEPAQDSGRRAEALRALAKPNGDARPIQLRHAETS
jgi:hypothetical protein